MAAKKKTRVESVDVNEEESVQRFIECEARINELRNKYSSFFTELDQLVQARNDALEEAVASCKQNRVSCGPIIIQNITKKVSAEKLVAAVGVQKFQELGGSVSTVTEYTIDKNRFEIAVASGQVPQAVYDIAVTETPTLASGVPKAYSI
jgi:hypothetical protein